MARIGLKIFYLRTRVRKVSQQQMAGELDIRQATLSNIERGLSLPSTPLLVELCRYFDVTPTYLIDEDRDILPLPSERWSIRNSLVTVGMWIQAPKKSVVDLGDGKLLCPLLPGEPFYDEEAKERRAADQPQEALAKRRRREERALLRALQGELREHPQRRRRKGAGK